MAQNRLYILFISLGITAIVMLWDSSEEILTPPRYGDEDTQVFPYAVAEDASTQHFGDDGEVDYSFTARKLEHFLIESRKNQRGEEYTLIDMPNFIIFEQQEPWHIESLRGKLVRATEKITLWDEVRIWQNLPAEDAATDATAPLTVSTSELTTSFLSINPKEKTAYTDEPVKISTPYGVINAIGMTADFKQRKIQLHERIRAVHRIPEQAEKSL